jgi:hypothetical protein
MSGEWLKASLRLPLQNGLKGKIYVKIIKQQLVFFHSLAQKKKGRTTGILFFTLALALAHSGKSVVCAPKNKKK